MCSEESFYKAFFVQNLQCLKINTKLIPSKPELEQKSLKKEERKELFPNISRSHPVAQ